MYYAVQDERNSPSYTTLGQYVEVWVTGVGAGLLVALS
jgi:hypothetical protein